ncbi:MAG: Txe/YoeB family addiction module toxin [Spirosomaceae bacterium]|jgi:toxin YoeB|nr:Txe/YoeB family addiction module toxin [Spirosomataceae bacterium]
MRKVTFSGDSYDKFIGLVIEDAKLFQRLNRIIQECRRTPFEGIGKPEPLKNQYKGYWSRRIDDKNRLIYKVTQDEIVVYAIKGHYDDK